MERKKIDTQKSYSWIVRNLLLALLFVAVVVGGTSVLLNVLTQHGKHISVPDFTNLTYSEARREASKAGVKVIVADSTYVKRLRPGVVYMQTPAAGSQVKKGRRVRLTTNTLLAKEVEMPSLVGSSLRQAKSELQRHGLVLGKLIYVNDIATNSVLRQQYRGRDIKPGTKLRSGSTVNLVLGLNAANELTHVPDLKGLQYLRATDVLQDNSLNIGKLHFDSEVKTYADSISATIYSQKPAAVVGTVRKGTEVQLYLK